MAGDGEHSDQTRPALWNPNAAAMWSLLLSPAFGAYLHAANWRSLGNQHRAAANMGWFWLTVGVLVFSLATPFLPLPDHFDESTRYFGIGLMVGWYTLEGRLQVLEVNGWPPNSYTKRSWAKPLVLGVVLLVGYLAIAFVLLVSREMLLEKNV